MGNRFVKGLLALFCLAGFSASAQELVPLPPQPGGLAWPTDGWEPAGMDPAVAAIVSPLIDKAIAGEKTGPMGETRAVVIIHRGRLVVEAYRDGFGPETKQVSWSMAKSVTSALVGRAVEIGLIKDIDAPMPTPFDAGDPRAKITWRQWLTMTDGLDYTEIGATSMADNDVIQMMYGPGRFDVLDYVRTELPPLHEPGTVWNYSTAAFHLIGQAVQGLLEDISISETATDQGLQRERGFLQEILLRPIGMDIELEFDSSGTFLGGSLVWASARDFAKFGYLYLRDGVWDGERLLPEGWVDFSRKKTPADNCNVYGAGWWITAYGAPLTHTQNATTPPWDAFHAGGHEGQTIWVVPSRDLVIVHLGLMENTDENWSALYEWNQEIVRVFPEVVAAPVE